MNAERVRRTWRRASVVALAAAVLLAGVGALALRLRRWPDDERVEFRFPEPAAPGDALSTAKDLSAPGAETRWIPAEAAAGEVSVVEAGEAWRPDGASPHAGWATLGRPAVRRRALGAPGPGAFEFALAVPPSAQLSFHTGALLPADASLAEVRFIVEVLDATGPAQAVYSAVAAPPVRRSAPARWFRTALGSVDPRETAWRRVRVSLAPWTGRTVRVRLRVDGVPAGLPTEEVRPPDAALPGAAPFAAFWAEPAVLVPSPTRPRRPDNLLLVVLGSLRPDGLSVRKGDGGAPNVERFLLEGVDFQRVYTNAVSPEGFVRALLTSRSAPESVAPADSLVSALARQGYRTAAIGLPADDGEFDEFHAAGRPGYETVDAGLAAVEWLAENAGGPPFFLLVHLRPAPATDVPWRYWLRSLSELPWGAAGLRRWRYRARAAYADEYAGRVLDVADAFRLSETSAVSVLSVRGEPLRRPGASAESDLSDENLRVVWGVRHRAVRAGSLVSEPVQTIDAAPTLLRLLGGTVPDGWRGSALDLSRADAPPVDPDVSFLTVAAGGRALIRGHHYKYVRRAPSTSGGRPRYGAEELYDLWTDPGEQRNLAGRRRTLLAELRRRMEELSPQSTETRIVFWDLRGLAATGSVESPGGTFHRFWSDGTFAPRGAARYDFEIRASSGAVRFEIRPPHAPFVLRMRVGDRTVPSDRIRVTRFGLPLFERAGVEWYDYNVFPWLEGIAIPSPNEVGPLVYLGRVPAPPESDAP
jgi:arylsulfatase A-like enzyme